MSVHKAITEHSNKQHKIVRRFVELDGLRETYIEEAVLLCKNGNPFETEKINEVTNEINQLARKGIVPTRKNVTVEMVQEYVTRLTATK
ncbi:accessory colonization factor AcfC [Oikeobacillus pervagus]|uniref:Accessory colonization factor AcfC n=1 Tax=Oikeobacillus pervagus TaxID=1325931 RepID=A0AAJ1SWD8_9BACI|nr:YpbS family protein [Oikeobacillus pervagus]MDQ0213970.1 accessory colonization factor AcfC [Oikeobacillus pervagus]